MTLDPESGAPVVAPVPPARLGGFEIIGVLGQGGFGRVYLARDPLLDRHVALKVLRADRLGDATHLQRFRREAAALSRLSHPSVVAVHAFGTAPETGEPYLVMEYAGGVPLSDLLLRDAGGRLSGEADASFGAADVVDLVSQPTQGLDADLAVRVVIRSPTHGEARSELAAARWGLTQRQAEVLVCTSANSSSARAWRTEHRWWRPSGS